jgi:hypothetical protein
VRAEKAEEEVAELVKKAQQLETELDVTGERYYKFMTKKLTECLSILFLLFLLTYPLGGFML